MIDPDTLLAFVTIAQLGHFVGAADRLGLAQSVVSKRLMRLEDQIGARLLERGKRNRIALTRAGTLFLPEARAALEALNRTEHLGRMFARGAAGPLRIGYVFSAIMTGILPDVIRALRSQFPDLELQSTLMETPQQIAAIRDGRLDFGIIRPRPTYPDGLVARHVHAEGIVVAISHDHPLSRITALRARDVAAHAMIVPQFHEEVGLIDVIRGIATKAAMPLPPILRTSDFITAAGLAAACEGVAIVPRSLNRLDLEGIRFREIEDHHALMELVLLAREDLPGDIAFLLEHFHDERKRDGFPKPHRGGVVCPGETNAGTQENRRSPARSLVLWTPARSAFRRDRTA